MEEFERPRAEDAVSLDDLEAPRTAKKLKGVLGRGRRAAHEAAHGGTVPQSNGKRVLRSRTNH
jgi:hypothetical protein